MTLKTGEDPPCYIYNPQGSTSCLILFLQRLPHEYPVFKEDLPKETIRCQAQPTRTSLCLYLRYSIFSLCSQYTEPFSCGLSDQEGTSEVPPLRL